MWNGKRVSIDSQFSQVCTDDAHTHHRLTLYGDDPSYEVSTLITFFPLSFRHLVQKGKYAKEMQIVELLASSTLCTHLYSYARCSS